VFALKSISQSGKLLKKLDIREEWVHELIKAKEIKATKIGKWRIKPEDLEKFIKSRTNK
jgi:excisionase family DNA binding protein